MKGYTDLEQSEKLAEILPLESADMYWWSSGKRYYIESIDDDDYDEAKDIRAWSLAALLNLIPKHIKEHNVLRTDIDENTFAMWYDEIGYGVNLELPDIEMSEPVDTCVEVILKLHELNLL